MEGSLLPANSGLLETTFETSLGDRWVDIGGAVAAIRTAKLVSPPPSFLPWLVLEYGLGELTPFVPNLYNLVVDREGVKWQRLRGTPAAVAKGLGFIGYSATLEDAWYGRAFWNSTQLRFPALPGTDDPDLSRIEGITQLSLAKRSLLRRGVYQYDAQAIELDRSRLDDGLLERESGVAVTAAGTLWSFGRTSEIDHVLTEAEGTAIGNWIDPPVGDSLLWIEMNYPWADADFGWADSPVVARQILMASWFESRSLYVTFRDAEGDIIGHRRCRAVRAVNQGFGAGYTFGAATYRPASAGTMLYIEAMTDFGDAQTVVAAGVELTIAPTLAADIPPGRLWLEPDDVLGGDAIAVGTIALPLRTTVRDQIKILMRF
ncbi:phage tail protein [Rhizobium sp. SU303]|uniref:phage tail protein n=1 Tax=Rhizobium sp. SU303 TaxID=3138065 RepID=UPI001E51F051|nr:phage tail protein [Rhizobium leguminosarum]UFW80024.1 phage tail protein [Rhizobium leguminosarum bv. viciae]